MSLTSPDLLLEFAKVATVTVVTTLSAAWVGLAWVPSPGTAQLESPIWETDRCLAVQQAIDLKIPTEEIARKVEAHKMSPLDAQCLMGVDVPEEIWIAALRSVSKTHARYRDVLDVPEPGS